MYFLIGVIILIAFIVGLIIYFKIKIRIILDKHGFLGLNLKDIIQNARIEDQEIPKSLSSMDSIYMSNIKRDFPDLNIQELKSKTEKVILDCYNAIESKDSSGLKGKIKSFTDDLIADYNNKSVSFDDFKFHNTVVSGYKNENGVITISFGSSFQYFLNVDGKSVKTQDRARVEFIYIIDTDKVLNDKKVLGLNCPNCGSPIKSLGNKSCSYCGSGIKEIFGKIFTCNNIKRY